MCAFCDIIRHKADAKVVYETDKIIAFLDIDPISDGHFHLHVFPRIKDDGFGWKYPEYGGRYTDEIALDLKEKLTD